MTWNPTKYAFSRAAVDLYAPSAGGVYALYKGDTVIYVGEAVRLREALMKHLASSDNCIQQWRPSEFSFDPLPAHERVARKNALILELRPVCNPDST